jgi:pilus assembly protein Flp/PilA
MPDSCPGGMTVKAPCQRTMPTVCRIGRHAIDFWHETSGATAIEYGLIAALIAVAIIGAIIHLGETLLGFPLQSISDALTGVLS